MKMQVRRDGDTFPDNAGLYMIEAQSTSPDRKRSMILARLLVYVIKGGLIVKRWDIHNQVCTAWFEEVDSDKNPWDLFRNKKKEIHISSPAVTQPRKVISIPLKHPKINLADVQDAEVEDCCKSSSGNVMSIFNGIK